MPNRDSIPDLNEECLLEPSHAAPNNTVSASCIDTEAGAAVTTMCSLQSNKNPADAVPPTFSIALDEGIDLFVDLNCDSPASCIKRYNELVRIPIDNDHSNHASKAINNVVSKGNHCPILPSGNIMADIQKNGVGSADCCTKPSICLVSGESSLLEHRDPNTAAKNSRSSASSLLGNLVEISGSQDGVRVEPSSKLTFKVQHNMDTGTMVDASDQEVLDQDTAIVRSGRRTASMADDFARPRGIIGRIRTEHVRRGGSNEDSFKVFVAKERTIDIPAGAEVSHNTDTNTHGILNENEQVEAVAMEDDVACGDSLPDVQLDASPEDVDAAVDFNLTNTTPSSATLASMVDTATENDFPQFQNAKATEKPGGSTENRNDEVYVALQKLQKIQDELLRRQRICQDRSAHYDMDIQKIMDEGEMTQKAMSILKGYEGSSSGMMEVDSSPSFGEGCQTMKVKRRKLTEGIFLRNRCKELDEICRENYWMSPRYLVDVVSVADEMYQASVYVIGLDFNINIDGDLKTSSSEARESAAANMLYHLHQRAKGKAADQNSKAPDAILPK